MHEGTPVRCGPWKPIERWAAHPRRQFTRPWRRLLFWACPWLPSARVNKAYHDCLYAAWDRVCDSVEAARLTCAPDDPSFLACIAQQRELSTGAPSRCYG